MEITSRRNIYKALCSSRRYQIRVGVHVKQWVDSGANIVSNQTVIILSPFVAVSAVFNKTA